MKIRVLNVLLLALFAAAPAAAQDKADAASRAKAIAPFINEQTFAVVHVDLTRVQVDPLVEKLSELVPDLRENKAQAKAQMEKELNAFRATGAKEIYALLSMADLGPRDPSVFLHPLGPGVNEKALTDQALKGMPFPLGAAKRIGQMLVVGHPDSIKRLEGIKPVDRPELKAAFQAAGDTAVQAVGLPPAYMRRVIEETMPLLPKEAGGGPSTVVTHGLQWAALGVDLPPKLSARLVVKSQDTQAAVALQAKWLQILQIVSQIEEARKLVPNIDEIAALLTPKVEEDRLTLTFNDQGQELAKLWKALQVPLNMAQGQARRSQLTNNLKQLALAMHNFHDLHKGFPAPANYGPDGKPLLSWRVHLLPFVEGNELYKQFHLDEPWDSAHNKALIDKMPAVFRSPLSKAKKGMTNYVLPVGPGTGFPGHEGTTFSDIKDGSSNTIMILEVDDDQAVIWTKPDDLPFDPKNPMKGLGKLNQDGFNAAYFDGSIRFLKKTIDPKILKALITPAGGEVVGEY